MTPGGSAASPARMKVMFLIDSLQSGGAERSLAEMLPVLDRLGVDPVVVCLRRSADSVEDMIRGRYPLHFVEKRQPLARVRAVRRAIRAERPHLLHTTLLYSDLVGRVAATGTRTPVLSSLVNTPYVKIRFEDPRIRPWVFRLVQTADGWTARRLTEHFHAITLAVKAHAVEKLRLPAERITVIERGRDGMRLGRPGSERRSAARRALGLSDDDEVLVHVGRQEYQKGQRYLLEAVERLAAGRPRLVLLMAGRRGAASEEIDRMRGSAAVADRVRFLGYREDIGDVLAAADLFVFPSLFEGLGGSLIEAMALGLPIVASDLDAIREVVEDGSNATLVPATSTQDLAAAIVDLLEDRPKAEAFALRSRVLFEERFSLERSTERMAELYRTIVPGIRAADPLTGAVHP